MVSRSGVKFAFAFLAMLIILSVAAPIPAQARLFRGAHPASVTHTAYILAPAPDKDAAVVVDGATGRVLYSRNPDEIRYPASLTKMMTLYLLFEALEKGQIKLDTQLNTSVHASEQQPTKVGLKPGETIPVETAIKAITVLSANDVAVVIAEALGQSEENFAAMMTAKAHQLGMLRTNFHNASGLPDPLQLTTASDMALLGRHIAYDFPQYYAYFSTPSFAFDGRTYFSHDNLLTNFGGTDGIKTGYTRDSGYNLVTSAVRNNKHIIGVVMGGTTAASRDHEMIRLLSASFDYVEKNPTIMADANVPWQGGKGPGFDPFKTTPTGDTNVLNASLDGPPTKSSPPVVLAGIQQTSGIPAALAATSPSSTIHTAQAGPGSTTVSNGVLTNGRTQLAALKARVLKAATSIRLGVPASRPRATDGIAVAQGDTDAVGPISVESGNVSAVKRWAVQIGAFASETLAQAQLAAYAKRALDVVGQAQRLVVPFASVDGHTLYRARFGLFAEGEARNICKRMSQRGETCYTTEIN